MRVRALLRRSERALAVVASIVTILVSLAAGGVVGNLWPVGVVVAEGGAIVVLGAWLYVERRTVRHHPADQESLADILSLLSRPAIQALRENDFAVAWPASLVYPFLIFVREQGSIEHRFRDSRLESARQRLYECADEFLLAEEYGHDVDRPAGRVVARRRYVGITGGEAEGDPERARLYDDAYRRILGPAVELREAHDTFLSVAIERDYDVRAVAGGGPTHPSVQFCLDLDERFG